MSAIATFLRDTGQVRKAQERAGAIPTGAAWLFEPKLDGFRCMVCTHDGFRARSRRGWDMTPLLPELAAALPTGLQLDGELVALDETGRPDFHRLSSRMLHGRAGIAVTFFAFDVLAVDGLSTETNPYEERRALLDQLDLEHRPVRLVATFEDGDALFGAVCARDSKASSGSGSTRRTARVRGAG